MSILESKRRERRRALRFGRGVADCTGRLRVRPPGLPGDRRRTVRTSSALNDAYDRFPSLGHGEWYGNAQRRDYTADTGFELHNLLDCGDPSFDVLIDHPSWIDHARRYAGESGTYVQGVTIDEHIATIRGAGGHHPVHSGGHDASVRTQYSFRNGRFRCGQLNVLVALTDIGPGDGPTMIVPGSHKANFVHPLAGDYAAGDRMDDLPTRCPCTAAPVTRWCSSTRACTEGARGPLPVNAG